MIENKFEVFISTDPTFAGLKIWFIDRGGGKQHVAQPVQLIFQEFGEAEMPEPTLTLNRYFADDFLRAMAEALNKRGVKVENEHKVHGQLEATKYHLEDLRALLKINTKEPPND